MLCGGDFGNLLIAGVVLNAVRKIRVAEVGGINNGLAGQQRHLAEQRLFLFVTVHASGRLAFF